MNNSNVAPAGGEKYSFVGRPDFARIIRENPGADVIIVSREDGLVYFLFYRGPYVPGQNSTTLDMWQIFKNSTTTWDNYHAGSKEYLPEGWVGFPAGEPEVIAGMRQVAQRFVALRNGKHTVETLP